MIVRVEALRYRCLRYVAEDIESFQVLVGPNASGKSAFFDVIAFLGDLLYGGPAVAVLAERANSCQEIAWQHAAFNFELAVELLIPDSLAPEASKHRRCRYEVRIGQRGPEEEIAILEETFWLKSENRAISNRSPQRTLFPAEQKPPRTLLAAEGKKRAPAGWRKVVTKVPKSGNDYFKSETSKWNNLFRVGPRKAALANLPEDDVKFPVATWAKRVLMEGVHTLALDTSAMKKPCPPGYPTSLFDNGGNLPLVVRSLQKRRPDKYRQWLTHVQSFLPDIENIRVVERDEDRHLYLVVQFRGGTAVPSWLLSDGTVRMVALTLLAYLPDQQGQIYLVEEPENGVHPRACEAVFNSLSSVYDGQILLATHSPLIVGLAEPEEILCFAKTPEGATDIVRGDDHPKLVDWHGTPHLSVLYASGVLS